jgi:hypothetical protein
MSSRPPKFEFRAYPPAKVAKVANFEAEYNQSSQVSQVSQGVVTEIIFPDTVAQATPGRCVECSWCQDNPWTHYPQFPKWCSWHFDYLAADSQTCQEWRTGEIPPPERIRATKDDDFTQAEVRAGVTCFQCHYFAPNDGPNPRQGWGRCQRRRRGRYGCAKVCKLFMEK